MEEQAKRNYLGAKYTLDNLKKQKTQILHGKFLHGYGVEYEGRANITKIYYDTQDCFFNRVGITISLFRKKGSPASLVVRFNDNTNRIMFLTDIPDTFEKNIGMHGRVSDNIDFISKSIYDLIPNGINADVKTMLKDIKPIISVDKKTEMYRIIAANGFKTIMSFSYCKYRNHTNKTKAKLELLELKSDANQTKEFPNFNKLLVFEFPEVVATKSSDIQVGFEFCTKWTISKPPKPVKEKKEKKK